MKKNERSYTRVTASICSELSSGKAASWVSGVTRDLSMRGVFIYCDEPLPEGSDCSLRLFLGDPKVRPCIEAAVKVVHATSEGMGVEFKEMDLSSYTYLHEMILLKAEDTKTVTDELKRPIGLKTRTQDR